MTSEDFEYTGCYENQDTERSTEPLQNIELSNTIPISELTKSKEFNPRWAAQDQREVLDFS